MTRTPSLPRRCWRATLLSAALAGISLASQAATSPYTALVVFGDSLSDSGNNALVLGTSTQIPTDNTYNPSAQPYASGTYSNGNVWVTGFAANLGLPSAAAPSLTPGGGDYAAGGARTTGTSIYPPSTTNQVNSFLAGVTTLPSTGLYVIATGGNDVRDTTAALAGGAAPSTVAAAAAAYATAVGAMVDALQAKGAQHIIVWDTPDLGKSPAAIATGSTVVASQIAGAFNQALAARLSGEAGVSIFDVYSFVDGIVANPAAYGMVNVTDACGALVNSCSASLSTSLFYDGIHPTAAGHTLLANAMTGLALAAVPEPATWGLMALGVLGIVGATRRRAAA